MARIIGFDPMESEQVNINVDLLHIGDVSDETTVDKRITVAKFHATAPAATATTKGAVSASSQTIGGVKTFADGIVVDDIHTGSGLDLTSFTRFLIVDAAPAVADMAERTLYLVNTVNDIYTGYYLIVDGNDRSRGQIGGRSYTGGTGISVNESTAVITNTLADQGGTIGGNTVVAGDLTIEGDIYQNGSAYETHAEKLYTKKDMIITRDGAQSALATGDLSGIKAEHYDANGNTGVLGFDNSGTARVGDEGDTQPLATRAEESDMVDGAVAKWNATDRCFESANFNESDFSAKQPKTMSAAVTVEGTSRNTVESAINALNTYTDKKQPSTLSAPIVVDGVSKTTVEDTLQAINTMVEGLSLGVETSYFGGIIAPTCRWLRFTSTDKKSLKIVANTLIKVGTKTFFADTDKIYDLSADISENGKDYFVYLNYEEVSGEDVWTLSAVVTKTADTSTSRYIGRFHTLCASVPAGTAMIYPTEQLASGAQVCLAPYSQDKDPDFYAFYLKAALAASVNQNNAYYTTSFEHPLAGFSAGDILPESVWCLTFRPDTKYEDAMFYDPVTGRAEDIYLQSGTGLSTRSAYGNVTLTRSRTPWSHQSDMMAVGKRLLKDWEFTSASMGSNQATNIAGSTFPSSSPYSGGHNDTSGRRMISMWGAEDTCGLLWQWLEEYVGNSAADWHIEDGSSNAPFGKAYYNVFQLLAGGSWGDGAQCGSRCRFADCVRSNVSAGVGGRGSSRVVRTIA